MVGGGRSQTGGAGARRYSTGLEEQSPSGSDGGMIWSVELLARHLLPQHPHVEVVESRSGTQAVVRGTRAGVNVVVGYGRRLAEANEGTAGQRSVRPPDRRDG